MRKYYIALLGLICLNFIPVTFIYAGTPPTAIFKANKTTICEGDTVIYTESSKPGTINQNGDPGTLISWEWTFPGGTPSTATEQGSQKVKYSIPGLYSTELKVTNNNTSTFMAVHDSTTQDYILVLAKASCHTGMKEENAGGTAFQISRNPFGENQITYSIAQPSQVSIEIYNIMGEKMRVVINTRQDKGDYTFDLNIRELGPPGIYIVKMEFNQKIYSEPIVTAQ